jgi:hypothetical protein
MSIVKLNNQAVKNATSFGSISSLGSMVFIKKLTASSSATLSFVDGSDGVVLDNSYKEYCFTFNNIHTSVDDADFTMNFSTDGGSNYNVTKTSTYFFAYLSEDNNFQGFRYETPFDLAQGTGFQTINNGLGASNDNSCSGFLTLSNPSSTTFVKHFMAESNSLRNALEIGYHSFVAGYGNTVNPIDAIRFQMSSGNIDAGDICLYGIA